ncbi:unnamed protein product [Ilex paraguariensis]|uniref:Uncharacterized protein n=1 Tax=Ilex paraguariensis TaxID=185542 RepID=A0ABC8RFF7_9AQUA
MDRSCESKPRIPSPPKGSQAKKNKAPSTPKILSGLVVALLCSGKGRQNWLLLRFQCRGNATELWVLPQYENLLQ